MSTKLLVWLWAGGTANRQAKPGRRSHDLLMQNQDEDCAVLQISSRGSIQESCTCSPCNLQRSGMASMDLAAKAAGGNSQARPQRWIEMLGQQRSRMRLQPLRVLCEVSPVV